MAEIVSSAASAIVEETVSLVFSGITTTTRKDEDKSDQEAAEDGIERLEMARIKMEAALETSDKWQITDLSLLHWRKKLKSAAQDCDNAARRCKQLSQDEEEREQLVRESSFPRRIAHATKAFVSSFLTRSNNNDHCSPGGSIAASVRKFERLADGAGEFMRFVQLGGIRRQHLFFDPLVRHIFAGKSLLYQVLDSRGRHRLYIQPMDYEERGLEAMLSFVYEDCMVPENSFRFGFMIRFSESTDIIGTAVKCLQLVTPHFKSTADVIIKEITRLPTQDFSCVSPKVANANMDNWNPRLWENVRKTLNGWFRPDPLCCQGYEHQGNVPSCGGSDGTGSNSDSGRKLRLSSIFPEPVYQVFLQRHISLSEYNNLVPVSSTTTSTGYLDTSALVKNFPPLKLGILFLPHDSWEMDLKSASEADYAIEAIDGEKQQHLTHINVHPGQLDEMLLPKATDYLYHNAEATTYEICWRSNHGSAHMCLEKPKMVRTCKSTKHKNNNKLLRHMERGQRIRKAPCKQIARDYLKLWVVRSSERLRTSISAWLSEDKANG